MKSILNKSLSILMSIVVLFSTMSFTVDMHYCGDSLIDISIFQKAKKCEIKIDNVSSKNCTIKTKNCCFNNQIFVKGYNQLNLTFNSLSINNHIFMVSFIYSYNNLFKNIEQTIYSQNYYSPPLAIKEKYKIYETYVI